MPYTKQTTRVFRFQGDTVFDAAGAATAVNVDAFLITRLLVNDADPTDRVGENEHRKISFNPLDAAIKDLTITASGKTITYQEWAQLTRKMVLDRANAQGIT